MILISIRVLIILFYMCLVEFEILTCW